MEAAIQCSHEALLTPTHLMDVALLQLARSAHPSQVTTRVLASQHVDELQEERVEATEWTWSPSLHQVSTRVLAYQHVDELRKERVEAEMHINP